jgi:hypothetical protein
MEMGMSYKGKAASASMLALAVVYGAYFWDAPGVDASGMTVLAHMAATVVQMVVVMIVFYIIMAIADRKPRHMADERDAVIGARAARNGYYTLLSLTWVAPILVLSGSPNIIIANILLGMIVLAELVHFGSHVFYDLRGA